MAIAQNPKIVLDCPDHVALAEFYAALLGWDVLEASDNWAEVGGTGTQVLAFQKIDAYTPPQWPDQTVPQQMHLDVEVADLDEGEEAVVALGATLHEFQPGTSFRVFLDPAGHPFCLCER